MRQKTKTKKATIKQKKRITKKSVNIYFEIVLAIIIIPLFSFSVLSILRGNGHNSIKNIFTNNSGIKVFTEKALYSKGENIELFIKNDSEKSIYFEPCEYLNKFEKMAGERWIKSSSYESAKIYNDVGFNKEKDFISCKIPLPENGAGIYRTVVKIYYECEKPGENMCKDSDIFYSNEFEVKL